MITLVKQELFKLLKKRSTPIISALLVIFIFGLAIVTKMNPTIFDAKGLFVQGFGAIFLLFLIMIATASTVVAMESQFGTIKDLLYRKYSRGAVLASKWLTVFLYSIYLNVLLFVAAIVAKLLFLPNFSLSSKVGDQTAVHALMTLLTGNFVNLWLIISLVLLLASAFNSSGASIAAGVGFYFLTSIVSSIQVLAIAKWDWMKWNPINMMNLSNQLSLGKAYEALTKLSTEQLIWGNLGYTVIFLFLGYLVFKRKNV
ncbi:ABC transporter permease [Dellaglioa sp. L3N]